MTQSDVHARSLTSDVNSIDRQFGKYRLIAQIGRGGMGDIYLAMARGPLGFKKLVVVKCLRMTSEDDEAMRSMFLDEGRLAAYLNHPNVVQTYDVGEVNGTLFIAMEYLEGQPLSRVARTVGRFNPRIAARIASDVLSGLHYAHELRGFDGTPLDIVHRDLSPPNIFVTYDGVIKLVDFGIAKTTLSSRALTEVGTLKGKVAYMAPEQAGRDVIDRRVDIFAMGIVLWELLVGRRLIEDRSAAAALKHLLLEVFPSVSSVLPEVDSSLDRIVARALEKNPAARYPTALQMREALEEYLARSGPMVRPEDVGQLLAAEFAEQHAQMQEQIQACIAASDAESAARLPILSRVRAGGDSNADSFPSSISAGGPHVPQQGGPCSLNPTGSRSRSSFRRRLGLISARTHPAVLWGASLVLLILLGVLPFAFRRASTVTRESLRTSAAVALSAAPITEQSPPSPSNAVELTTQSGQFKTQGKNNSDLAAPTDGIGRSTGADTRSAESINARSHVARTHTSVRPQATSVALSLPASPATKETTGAAVFNPAEKTDAKKRVPLVVDRPHVDLVE